VRGVRINVSESVLLNKGLDKTEFCSLVEQKKDNLYRIAFMYVKNQEDALDIVHEAVYKAYISLDKLKDSTYFNTWLTRIVINCSLNHIRKNKKALNFQEYSFWPAPKEENKEEFMDLYEAVDNLNGKYKTVIILKYFEDLTISSIAEIMDCPLNTVKTYLHKALKLLRIQLKEEDF
jgi:RNA polymerase sigma-70 factor (ECF subfamily)